MMECLPTMILFAALVIKNKALMSLQQSISWLPGLHGLQKLKSQASATSEAFHRLNVRH